MIVDCHEMTDIRMQPHVQIAQIIPVPQNVLDALELRCPICFASPERLAISQHSQQT